MVLSLVAFSTELLIKIFKYLDIHDLCRLRQTCRRFNEIIEKWGHSLNQNVRPIVTNQIHPHVVNRSMRLLSAIDRVRVSRNWRLGIYTENVFLYTKTKYIPWLQLEKDLLWIGRGRSIQAYRRTRKGINSRSVCTIQVNNNTAEVCRFVKKGKLILSGQTDGSLWLWSQENHSFVFKLENYHESDINSVDMCDDIIVTGSTDNHVKIRTQESENASCHKINVHDRVWSVALSKGNQLLAIGTAGLNNFKTLNVFDINKKNLIFDPIMVSGILDMQWESPSVLWTCGYSGQVMKWDLRAGRCEQTFVDPSYASVYCFQYDGFNTIISGTQSHGRAVLWDTRQENYIQMYFMNSCRFPGQSSPLYSLSYDAEFLFALTDRCVNTLNFSMYNGTSKDYSNLFSKSIRV